MHQLKPPFAIPILILCTVAASANAADTRFSGSASLNKPAELATSATGQFSVSAGLRPGPALQSAGRFGLTAKLQPNDKSVSTACGPLNDLIFANGFE